MTLSEYVIIGGFLLTLAGIVYRQATNTTATQASAKAAQAIAIEAKEAAAAANARAERVGADLSAYREIVAREYVSANALRDWMRDVREDIKGLVSRVDQFISGHHS